jgi:asparagine synthase (glutamine-hydrolysing)
MTARALTAVPPETWDTGFARLSALLPSRWQPREAGDKIYRLADLLPADTSTELYHTLMSRWRSPTAVVLDARAPSAALTNDAGRELSTFVQRMMYFDLMTYLPDDILVKVDRASMGVGLEVRIPLLDHRLVEFAWRSPLSMMIKGNRGKWLLRQVLDRHVPAALTDRPKRGFSVPLSAWLRGPLRAWAEGLLCRRRVREDGYLDAQQIDQKWREHLSEHRNWSRELWEVLMFQAWLDAQRDARVTS